MRRRVKRVDVGLPEIVPIDGAARLVTLESPEAPLGEAAGAFARLRPPEGMAADEVATWRDRVASVARAVRVVSAPRAAAVPLASTRVDEEPVGTVREEALLLARETGDAEVEALTARLLDEAGA